MMSDRRGEKIGWIGGWLGAFCWVVILAIVFLVRGNLPAGAAGLVLAGAAFLLVVLVTPWRHPRTPYWQLMAPLYVVLLLAVAWTVWAFGGMEASGWRWWHLAWMLPVLGPLLTIGRRRWNGTSE
jgi:hypothetical protein